MCAAASASSWAELRKTAPVGWRTVVMGSVGCPFTAIRRAGMRAETSGATHVARRAHLPAGGDTGGDKEWGRDFRPSSVAQGLAKGSTAAVIASRTPSGRARSARPT